MAMTHVQGPDAQRFDAEVALRPAAALRHRIAEPGRNIAFFFQAIERAIQRTDGDGSAGAIFDFAPHGNAVGILPESEDGEECDLLEFAQMLARRHMFCTIGQYESSVKPVPARTQFGFIGSSTDGRVGPNRRWIGRYSSRGRYLGD